VRAGKGFEVERDPNAGTRDLDVFDREQCSLHADVRDCIANATAFRNSSAAVLTVLTAVSDVYGLLPSAIRVVLVETAVTQIVRSCNALRLAVVLAIQPPSHQQLSHCVSIPQAAVQKRVYVSLGVYEMLTSGCLGWHSAHRDGHADKPLLCHHSILSIRPDLMPVESSITEHDSPPPQSHTSP